jgi:hypothetical protein
MIRRLVEADIFNTPDPPPAEQSRFWLMECRTPDLLIPLRKKFKTQADNLLTLRPLLAQALSGKEEGIRVLLKEEEEHARKLDKEYWAPLRQELEIWRRERPNPT